MSKIGKSEVITQIENTRSEASFTPTDLREVSRIDEDSVVIDGTEYEMTDWAFRQIMGDFSIPHTFYRKMDRDAKDEILRCRMGEIYSPREGFSDRKMRMVGDKCTAMLHPDYPEIPVEALIADLPDWHYDLMSADPDQPILRYRGVERKLMVMDDLCYGFDFVYSEVGGLGEKDGIMIDALIVKLACMNGMVRTRPSGGGPYFTIAPLALPDQEELLPIVMKHMVKKMKNDNDALKVAFEKAMDRKVKVRQVLEGWFERKIPTVIPKKTIAAWEKQGRQQEMTLEELAQLVANVGTQIPSYKNRRHFERLAGRLLKLGVTATAN